MKSTSVLICLACQNGVMGVSQRPKDLECKSGYNVSTSIYKDAYIVEGSICEGFTSNHSNFITKPQTFTLARHEESCKACNT